MVPITRMDECVTYIGKDLEAMDFAGNYHRWILAHFRPFLGQRLVEVGAGTGGFSELLLAEKLSSISLLEPSRMFAQLEARVTRLNPPFEIKTYNSLFRSVAEQIRLDQRPDSIVYVNVLEHVEDDLAELRAMHGALAKNGRIFIFVPALPALYSNYDRQIGHHRRYTRRELVEKSEAAGFRTIKSGYFDFAGILPWWLKYRVMGSEQMEASALKFYDKYIVPATRAFESVVTPPIGKNVILIGERS